MDPLYSLRVCCCALFKDFSTDLSYSLPPEQRQLRLSPSRCRGNDSGCQSCAQHLLDSLLRTKRSATSLSAPWMSSFIASMLSSNTHRPIHNHRQTATAHAKLTWFTFQQIRILAAVTNPACYVLRAFWDSNNEHSKSWSFEFATFLSSQQELQSQIGDDNPLQFRCSFQIRLNFFSIWSVACANYYFMNYYQHELFLHELFLHENVRI